MHILFYFCRSCISSFRFLNLQIQHCYTHVYTVHHTYLPDGVETYVNSWKVCEYCNARIEVNCIKGSIFTFICTIFIVCTIAEEVIRSFFPFLFLLFAPQLRNCAWICSAPFLLFEFYFFHCCVILSFLGSVSVMPFLTFPCTGPGILQGLLWFQAIMIVSLRHDFCLLLFNMSFEDALTYKNRISLEGSKLVWYILCNLTNKRQKKENGWNLEAQYAAHYASKF